MDIVVPSKVVRLKSGAGRFTMVTPLRPVMGSLFSMPHIKSPRKPMIANAANAKADFRKIIFGSISLLGPHGTFSGR
jgi:hypothetical protein